MNTIRKISVGRDYKVDAMHYQLNQQVYGGHIICDIIEEENAYVCTLKKTKRYYLGSLLIRTWV